MPIRTFSLKSDEAHAALCVPVAEPWIKNGSLPPEPRWPRKPAGVWVSAETDDAAAEAFGDWLRHVESGRIG